MSFLYQSAELKRLHSTRSERILENAMIHAKGFGRNSFVSQAVIGPYIADFYFPKVKMVVEVDGPGHRSKYYQDAARTSILSDYGCTVLRFENEIVESRTRMVLGIIKDAIRKINSRILREENKKRKRECRYRSNLAAAIKDNKKLEGFRESRELRRSKHISESNKTCQSAENYELDLKPE